MAGGKKSGGIGALQGRGGHAPAGRALCCHLLLVLLKGQGRHAGPIHTHRNAHIRIYTYTYVVIRRQKRVCTYINVYVRIQKRIHTYDDAPAGRAIGRDLFLVLLKGQGRHGGPKQPILSQVQIDNSYMEVLGNLLDLIPNFCLSSNLKAQILEICPSAQESAIFYHTVDFERISATGQ